MLNAVTPPHINIRNSRRSPLQNPPVYQLKFDNDFSVLQRRATNTLIRIGYSDNPRYWAEIVAARPDNRKTKRELQQEVDDIHGGDWHGWLDHHWNLERRATPDHKLHLLHKRWFSLEPDRCISKMREVQVEYTALRHRVSDVYTVTLFDETKVCRRARYSAPSCKPPWTSTSKHPPS